MKLKTIYTLITVMVILGASCGSPAPKPVAEPPKKAEAPISTSKNVQRSKDIIIDGAQNYTVVKGDVLVNISRRYYNNGFYYPIIILASGEVVSDPDEISPGMKLLVPNLNTNLQDSTAKARLKSFTGQIADINDRRGRKKDAEELRKLANSF